MRFTTQKDEWSGNVLHCLLLSTFFPYHESFIYFNHVYFNR